MMYTFGLFFHSFFLPTGIYTKQWITSTMQQGGVERERRWKGGSSAFSSRTRWMGIVGKRKPTDQEEEEDDDWTNE